MAKAAESPVADQDLVLDLDSFVSREGVEPIWINGLMIWLATRGGMSARPLAEWQQLLRTYQGLR